MQFMDSETAPVQDGIPTVKGKPPIILRGDFQTDSNVLSIDNIEKLKISFNSIIMSIKKQSELKYEIY